MIYAGFINFNSAPFDSEKLQDILQSFTDCQIHILHQKHLTISYGKISSTQDLDDIWKSDSLFLMGRIFDKENNVACEKEAFRGLDHQPQEKILEKIWGKYVCFKIDNQALQVQIFIDSTGQLPFFYYSFSDGSIFFASDIEIIYNFLSIKPKYNWNYLFNYVRFSNNSSVETPFQNIHELPPACSLSITKDKQNRQPLWNPVASQCLTNGQHKDAVDVLSSTLRPWVEPYQNIYISLSGGLDSSALAYCLKALVKNDQKLGSVKKNYLNQISIATMFKKAM